MNLLIVSVTAAASVLSYGCAFWQAPQAARAKTTSVRGLFAYQAAGTSM